MTHGQCVRAADREHTRVRTGARRLANRDCDRPEMAAATARTGTSRISSRSRAAAWSLTAARFCTATGSDPGSGAERWSGSTCATLELVRDQNDW